MPTILRQRRDTEANWTSSNPVIPDGQLCFDSTNDTYRIGNGVDNYLTLVLQSGEVGNGIASIIRTVGDGTEGTTDTYTITFTDAATTTFSVVNGSDGDGTGDVVGPASAADDRIATFDGVTGKLIQDSGKTIAELVVFPFTNNEMLSQTCAIALYF